MASYLGKISALVTANTGPFRSALNATKQDLDKWRNDVNRTLNTAAAGNWEKKILLPIQQIERAIRDANSTPLSIGIDQAMLDRVRQMTRLTEGIAEPLAQAVGQFKSMGGAIQASLLPALQQVQNAALEMKNEISDGVTKSEADFRRLERQTDRLTQALSRAREASSLVSAIPTGREFRFAQPAAAAAMRETAAMVSNAEKVFGAGDPRAARFAAASNARARLIENLSAKREDYEMRGFTGLAAETQRRIDRAIRKQQTEEAAIGSQMVGVLPPNRLQDREDARFREFMARQRMERDQERRRIQAEDAAAGIGTLDVLPPNFLQDRDAANRRRRARQELDSAFERVGLGRDAAGIERALNTQALSGYTAQLQILQRVLSGTSESARGPAVKAFSTLRDAIARAFSEGRLETDDFRRSIKALTQDAVRAAALANPRITARGLTRSLERTGDIGRGAFSNSGLAVQQAAFAVEDFFSVTGGLDQRIRAAGNNISQLGFIIGGTTGLFLGIAAALGGQVIAALLKFVDTGASAQDRAQALTDSLKAQKDAVRELADAFKDLTREAAGAGVSQFRRQQKERQARVDRLGDALKQSREAELFGSDPAVLSATANRIAAENRLSQATTVQEAEAAQAQVKAAARAEESAKENARARKPRTAAEVQAQIDDIRAEARRRDELNGGGTINQDVAEVKIANILRTQAAAVRYAERLKTDPIAQNAALALAGGERVAALTRSRIGDDVSSEIGKRLDAAEAIRESIGKAIEEFAAAGEDTTALEQVAINASKMEIGLLGAATAMTEFSRIIDKVTQSIASDVSSMEQRADQLRRESLVGMPGAAGAFGVASAGAAEVRSLQQRALDAMSVARQRVEETVLAGDNQRLGEIDRALTKPGLTADAREQLLAERRRIMATRDAAMAADPGVRAALGMQDEASRMAGQAALFDAGRELAMTPGQRMARDFNRQLEGVRQFFGQTAEETTGIVDFVGQQQTMRRVFDDAARQAAPMIFSFADEVATARLQGPSRAALNFADVATMEGQREMNRLLRGEDPARDVNLMELQKQTGLLEELAKTAREFGVDVAN